MNQKTISKPALKKKTISRLTEKETKAVQGGSIYFPPIVFYSTACQTDFTRPISPIFIPGH
ncbi:MAG: class I lanthipeptide [Chitinophagaceae bacterium]|nr:class I lanthipeptide [Chitinophagaceae bacterium]